MGGRKYIYLYLSISLVANLPFILCHLHPSWSHWMQGRTLLLSDHQVDYIFLITFARKRLKAVSLSAPELPSFRQGLDEIFSVLGRDCTRMKGNFSFLSSLALTPPPCPCAVFTPNPSTPFALPGALVKSQAKNERIESKVFSHHTGQVFLHHVEGWWDEQTTLLPHKQDQEGANEKGRV